MKTMFRTTDYMISFILALAVLPAPEVLIRAKIHVPVAGGGRTHIRSAASTLKQKPLPFGNHLPTGQQQQGFVSYNWMRFVVSSGVDLAQ